MTEAEAKTLIERQRRRWRSQASDEAIARRVERLGTVFVCIYLVLGVSCALVLPTVLARVLSGTGFLAVGALFAWNSRRFAKARQLLAPGKRP